MNKKLIAVAIAAALAPAVAMADSGNVTIYGSLHMSVESLKGASGAAGSTDNQTETNISSNSSYIGFKGSEDLGNGLKAIWQIESGVGMGDGTTSSLATRNTYLGLNGGFGTALLGRHDTPFKIVGRKADLFSDQIGDSRNMISVGGAGWDLRPDNVIAYVSPTMSGFTGAVAYVTNVDALAAEQRSVTALSAMGTYENGPLMLGLGYEKHNLSNTNGTATVVAPYAIDPTTGLVSGTAGAPLANVKDEKAWRLVGGYSFGDAKVTALYQKITDIGGGDTDRKVWGLGAAYKLGATTIKGQYYKAGDLTSCAANVDCGSTGANMFAIGADYSLSKRTTAYVAYAKTDNDSGATAGTGASFSAFGGGHGDNPGTIAGKDPSGLSIGMKHSF